MELATTPSDTGQCFHTETFNECSVSPSSTQLNTGTFRYLSSPLRQTEGLTEAFPNSLSPLRVIVDCLGPQREFYRLLWYTKVCFSPYSAFMRIFCCTRSAHVHIEDFRDSQSSLRSKQRCSGSLEVFSETNRYFRDSSGPFNYTEVHFDSHRGL